MNVDMAFEDLCEADSSLPDGLTEVYDIGNCGNHDVFEYTCQPDSTDAQFFASF